MMETMIPPQAGMRLRTKYKKRKKEAIKIEKAEIKNERKKEKGNATILLPHMCFKVAP